ncbi:SDR family NAD(P)-dependent oxidoreductase [Halobacillus litoralis]|uniref:SDR family NAD(P)-dependent oxidoreductase n=1 Tax=Halobacillus litoralis TaxID=45668 RepID=UPI002490C324|nr:glucose 1-dehydrogenase [Halobacillus litoralis]
MEVEGKVAIVTGGGTGIGKETAVTLAKEGATVVVTDVNEESGKNTINEIEENGGQSLFVKQDVTSEEDWRTVVAKTVNQFHSIDILFNNAGIFVIKPLVETEVEEWNHLMNINVTGPFLGMKHVLPIMQKNKSGSIINSSSNAGLFGAAGLSLYSASKGAIRILSKSVAMEYASHNIRINSIHPGYIKTQMIEYAAQVANKQAEDQSSLVPLKRLGTTQEVANMVLYLASEKSSYVTGSEFVIDGGVSSGHSVWEEE